MGDVNYPNINRKIQDFIYEEEGNVSRDKILFIGSMLVILAAMIPSKVYASHSSHSSHSSHTSSTSYSAGHESHQSHTSSSIQVPQNTIEVPQIPDLTPTLK